MTRSTSNQSASASSYATFWFPCCGVHYEALGSGTLACLHNIKAISVYRTAVDNRILKLVILLLGRAKLHRHDEDDDDDDDDNDDESCAEYEAV